MKRSEKINIIKDKLAPLLTKIDPNSPIPERYSFDTGNETYKIIKDFIQGNNNTLMEVYATVIFNNTKKRPRGLGTFCYQLPYDKGNADFIDIGGWCFQII